MQDETGAFANVLGTIRTLPALIGSVYYDVKDLVCPKPGQMVFRVSKMLTLVKSFVVFLLKVL